MIPSATALPLSELIAMPDHGVLSRVLTKTAGGNVTLFAFAAGEGLSEHTAPFDALVLVLQGALSLTIGGVTITAPADTMVRLPANVPHAVDAESPARMLLILLRESASQP